MSSFVTTPLGSHSPLSEDEVNSDDRFILCVTTSRHSNFVFKVRRFETIAEVKGRVVMFVQSDHPRCGEIKILAVKFKRQNQLCSLEDNLCLHMILDEAKDCFPSIYMDVSCSAEHWELNNNQGWSTDKDSDKEENNLQNYPDGRVDIAANEDNVKQVDFCAAAKETSPGELPKNPLIAPEQKIGAQQSVSEQGDCTGEFIGDEIAPEQKIGARQSVSEQGEFIGDEIAPEQKIGARQSVSEQGEFIGDEIQKAKVASSLTEPKEPNNKKKRIHEKLDDGAASFESSSWPNEGELDSDDEDEEGEKKRVRKPIKARSLKSLM